MAFSGLNALIEIDFPTGTEKVFPFDLIIDAF